MSEQINESEKIVEPKKINEPEEQLVSRKHQDKISKHLDSTYANDKGKKFVLHLIRSYLPMNKVEKLWDKPENGQCRCSLCRTKLFSVGEAFEGIRTDEFKDGFFDFLKKSVNGEAKIGDHPISKWKGNRTMGFTGKDTNTYMCMSCVKVFFDWAVSKMLSGDGTVNWLMNKMQKDGMINTIDNYVEMNPGATTEKQAKSAKKVINAHEDKNYPKATLGDIDALQQLYAKMTAEEEKESKK